MLNLALALGLGAERRRAHQDPQIVAVAQRGLEGFQVRLDGAHLLRFSRQIEQGLRVAPTHIRSLGIVRHLLVRPVRLESRWRRSPLQP